MTNKYGVSIDLKKLPLVRRNKYVDVIKRLRIYYSLEAQVISFDEKHLSKVVFNMGDIPTSRDD